MTESLLYINISFSVVFKRIELNSSRVNLDMISQNLGQTFLRKWHVDLT